MGIQGIVLTGIFAAPLVPLAFKIFRNFSPWLISIIPFFLFFRLFTLIDQVRRTDVLVVSRAWIPGLDIRLTFLVDGLSLLFALLITGIGGGVFFYSKDYLKEDPHIARFYGFLLLFMGSMLGLVLAGNLLCLYVFWELTTVSSFLLIGYHHEEKESRRAAVQALVVTNIGGLALLAGFVLLALAGGGYEINDLLAKGETIRQHAFYLPIVLLLLLGAFTKSAQFPFHFWLPNAMRAPTPVSAYLHSATMVKGGVYLIARMHPILGGGEMWTVLIATVGGFSLLLGGFMALVQRDMKRMLAYSTIAVLGMLIMLLGIGGEEAIKAAIIYLFAHALYKATFFLCAGAIDHKIGTRDLTKMGGLGSAMPLIAIAGATAAFSKSGLPPAMGFIGKEMIFKTGLQAPGASGLFIVVLVLGSMFLAAVGWIAGLRPFFGKQKTVGDKSHSICFAMWTVPFLLGLCGILWGLFPDGVEKAVLRPAVSAVLKHSTTLDMALWHGFNKSLALSAAAIGGGSVLFYFRGTIRQAVIRLGETLRFDSDILYDSGMSMLSRYAAARTRILQTGYLRHYLLIVFCFAAALVLITVFPAKEVDLSLFELTFVNVLAVAVSLLIVGAVAVVIRSPSTLAAVIALGVVGYGLAIYYVLFSAPDLAITQILVETVTLILFVLIVYRLPKLKRMSSPRTRGINAIVAAAVGTVMTILTLEANTVRLGERISDFFAEYSYQAAYGKNVVNVIIVDFRALDTFGEITVLAIMALGVFALMRLRLSSRK